MKILYVDDDPEDRELFSEVITYLGSSDFLFQKESIECLFANDGLNAIEKLTNSGDLPEVIFSDINMPLMGGKKLLQHLKSHPQFLNIPVIMFSTVCDVNEAKTFKAMGALDCIKKPSGFKNLVRVISKIIYKNY